MGIGFGVWGRGRASLTFRAAVQYRVAALERLGLASEEDLIAHRVAARQRWCTRLVTRLRCTSMVFDRGPYHALHTDRKLRGSMSCPPPHNSVYILGCMFDWGPLYPIAKLIYRSICTHRTRRAPAEGGRAHHHRTHRRLGRVALGSKRHLVRVRVKIRVGVGVGDRVWGLG